MTGEETFSNLHEVLRNLYDEMMPLCSDITGVATGVAALGALFYVASRVWQALSRAEPIDIYPLFRPFCLGACIMFFPTFVLGTLNGIMSPVVTGCHSIMEGQTLNIREYSEKRQKLEYEAMTRNPETAYLVDNEEYERQIEDLGWSPSDLKAMAGMAAERLKYQARQSVSNFLPQLSGTAVPVGFAGTGHAENLLPDRIEHSGTSVIRHIGVRRLPQYDDPMDLPVYQHLSVAAHIRPVQLRAGKDSGADDREGHRCTERSRLCARREQFRLHHLHADSHCGAISPFRQYPHG